MNSSTPFNYIGVALGLVLSACFLHHEQWQVYQKIRDKDIETNDAPKPKQRRARTIPRPSIGEHGPLEQIETNK